MAELRQRQRERRRCVAVERGRAPGSESIDYGATHRGAAGLERPASDAPGERGVAALVLGDAVKLASELRIARPRGLFGHDGRGDGFSNATFEHVESRELDQRRALEATRDVERPEREAT
jgi:hypothetical protein